MWLRQIRSCDCSFHKEVAKRYVGQAEVERKFWNIFSIGEVEKELTESDD